MTLFSMVLTYVHLMTKRNPSKFTGESTSLMKMCHFKLYFQKCYCSSNLSEFKFELSAGVCAFIYIFNSLYTLRSLIDVPPSVMNFSKFFHPGHSYSNPPPLTRQFSGFFYPWHSQVWKKHSYKNSLKETLAL